MTITAIASGTSARFIDPLTDFGFKHLLGSEPSKDIMINFLSAIFEGEKEIVDLVFSPTEYAASTNKYKKVYFDLMCTGKDLILIKRNMSWNRIWINGSIFLKI